MNKNIFSTFVSTLTITAILLGFLGLASPIEAASISSVAISNTIRNISSATSEADSVSAYPNDTVELIIRVINTNNTNTVDGVTVLDALPNGLTYISGSTSVDGISKSDGIAAGGLGIGTISLYQTKTIKFRASVNAPSYFSTGTTSLTNYAHVYANNASTANDTATVSVVRNDSTVINSISVISLRQFGMNVSRAQTTEQTSIVANPGNTVEIVIRVQSNSNININNIVLKDILPAGLSYVANSTSLNNIAISEGVTTNGVNIGRLIPGQEAVIRLFATINGTYSFNSGTTNLTNTVQIYADSISTMTSYMAVTVTRGVINQVGQVKTGPSESILISLMFSAFVSFLYMAYATRGDNKRKSLMALMTSQRSDKTKFNFR